MPFSLSAGPAQRKSNRGRITNVASSSHRDFPAQGKSNARLDRCANQQISRSSAIPRRRTCRGADNASRCGDRAEQDQESGSGVRAVREQGDLPSTQGAEQESGIRNQASKAVGEQGDCLDSRSRNRNQESGIRRQGCRGTRRLRRLKEQNRNQESESGVRALGEQAIASTQGIRRKGHRQNHD
jgi:hypothetical protein